MQKEQNSFQTLRWWVGGGGDPFRERTKQQEGALGACGHVSWLSKGLCSTHWLHWLAGANQRIQTFVSVMHSTCKGLDVSCHDDCLDSASNLHLVHVHFTDLKLSRISVFRCQDAWEVAKDGI